QFFALIDVEEKGGGLDPIEVLVTALGLAEQIGKSGFPVRVEQLLDPFVPVLDAGGIASVELPSVKKRLNQRLQRFGSGLQGEETPAAAILKSLRPCAGRARPLGPCLALERRQHARLCERRFAHARIAEQKREPVRRGGNRREHINRFLPSAEEIVAVLLLHRGKAAIGLCVAPQLTQPGASTRRRIKQPSHVLFG